MISRRKAGLVLGPVLFLFILLSDIEGISWEAKSIAASTAWIACWWLTEAIPIPATSLLPIILFPLLGGGLAIAKGFIETGLDAGIAQQLLFLKDMPSVVIILAVVTLTLLLTEITSNTATATIILPVTASLAAALGIEPMGLMIAAAISSSLAFMLPVATPPNAIVFGTGYVTIPQMAKAGFWMNLFCIAIITLFVTLKLLYD